MFPLSVGLWLGTFRALSRGGVVTDSLRHAPEEVRTAEVIAALCLATDLGMGFPFEHGFHATLIAMRLCDLLDVDNATARQVFYACMLIYSGCTADGAILSEIFAGPQTENLIPSLFGSSAERAGGVLGALPPPYAPPSIKVVETLRRLPAAVRVTKPHQAALCEVAEMLSRRLGLPDEISGLFRFLTDRWDGKSMLKRASGAEVPLPLRVAVVARDAAFQRHIGGDEYAKRVVGDRAGHAFDPQIALRFVEEAEDVFTFSGSGASAWDAVLAAEPQPHLMLVGDGIDQALAAIGDFADLLSPSLAGHSAGLARLVARAAEVAGMTDAEIRSVRRAALVHDVGRVAVPASVWEQRGALSADQLEQVRLHPYQTQRILSHSGFFDDLARIATDHHERLDGSGYHRGMTGSALGRASRLLAAADSFHAMTEARPYRDPHRIDDAARLLGADVEAGRLDPEMVGAVLVAAGAPSRPVQRPAGLTVREAEVVGLLARGLQTKQVAAQLDISPKTVDTHIQNAYRKIGVSTRAAATLFAMEHRLVFSGEFPIYE